MSRLVITRKTQQSFDVGDDVTVTIVEVGRGQVKVAIHAPRDVKILRSELVKRGPGHDRLQ